MILSSWPVSMKHWMPLHGVRSGGGGGGNGSSWECIRAKTQTAIGQGDGDGGGDGGGDGCTGERAGGEGGGGGGGGDDGGLGGGIGGLGFIHAMVWHQQPEALGRGAKTRPFTGRALPRV